MAIEDIDLTGNAPIQQADDITSKSNATANEQQKSEQTKAEESGGLQNVVSPNSEHQKQTNTNEEEKQSSTPSSTGELQEGDKIEYDGKTYVVSNTGDLVDNKGNVFKKSTEVNDWLQQNTVTDTTEEPSLMQSIQEAVGVDIVDAEGKPVDFTNDAEGIKSYVQSVVDLQLNDVRNATINQLYANNPLLKDFVNYVQINGSPRGFGDMPDRRGLTVDENNEEQQAAIIRMAASEFGNPSLNENYIKYLKDSGGLADEAKAQLQALQNYDAQVRQQMEEEAKQQTAQEQEQLQNFWNDTFAIIDSKSFDGYNIPESFTKEINGQKVVLTINDFKNYLTQTYDYDENGNPLTGYQIDRNNITYEDGLQKEILDAWLMFTGSTYKDLINLAMKEDKVKQLRVKANESRNNKSIKVIKKPTKATLNDIILG